MVPSSLGLAEIDMVP